MYPITCPHCRQVFTAAAGPGQLAVCGFCGCRVAVPAMGLVPQPPAPVQVAFEPPAEASPPALRVRHDHRAVAPTRTGFGFGFGFGLGMIAAGIFAFVCLLLWVNHLISNARTPPETRDVHIEPIRHPKPPAIKIEPQPAGAGAARLDQKMHFYYQARKIIAAGGGDGELAPLYTKHNVLPRDLDRILTAGDRAGWPGSDLAKQAGQSK